MVELLLPGSFSACALALVQLSGNVRPCWHSQWCRDTSDPRHFRPKTFRHWGRSVRTLRPQCRNVLGLKCLGSEVSRHHWLCQQGRTLPESWTKASAHALNEPGSNNSTISVTTGHFQGYHFFKNKTMYFLRMPLSFWASLFFFFFLY